MSFVIDEILPEFLVRLPKTTQSHFSIFSPETPPELVEELAYATDAYQRQEILSKMRSGFEWFLDQEGRRKRRLIQIPATASAESYAEYLSLVSDVLQSRHMSTILATLASIEIDAEWLKLVNFQYATTQTDRQIRRLEKGIGTLGAFLGSGNSANKVFHNHSVADVEEALLKISSEQIRIFAQNPSLVHSQLSPRQFEYLVAEVLRDFGWDIEVTQSTRDGGYDIFAISKSVDGSSVRSSFLVECKKNRPDRKVGISVVRQLLHVKNEKSVSHALLVTTSDFTSGVYDYAANRWDLDLRSFEGLLEWCRNYNKN